MFLFTITGQEAISKLYKKAESNFIKDVSKKWAKGQQIITRDIVKNQLTGRKGSMGLNRVTGNAARVLNSTTKIEGRDLIQRIFLARTNPAKIYLPIHDKSRSKGGGDFARGIIKAKRAKYLVFKTRDGNWHSKKEVKIPVRTNILEELIKQGGRMRMKTLNEVLQSYAV